MVKIKEAFDKAGKKLITYSELISTLNGISDVTDTPAYFSQSLKTSDNKTVAGFVFPDYQTGQKLSNILENLGFKYVHYIANINSMAGELHIDPSQTKQAVDLFNGWTSNVKTALQVNGNQEILAQWSKVVNVK